MRRVEQGRRERGRRERGRPAEVQWTNEKQKKYHVWGY